MNTLALLKMALYEVKYEKEEIDNNSNFYITCRVNNNYRE